MNYLALCCIVKDEDPFLSEWFMYHALAGVEHFYVYDNESAVPVKNNPVLTLLLQAGRATVHEIKGKHRQYAAYDHCFKKYGADNFWIGALDLDEFVYQARPAGRESEWLDFRPFLAEFEEHAGLALNWSTMSSSGQLKRPQGLVTATYREKLLGADNSDHHIKTFLRADRFAGTSLNPHNFAVRPGASVVNEKHHPIPPERPFFPPFNERAWIYHYFFKSQEDFEIKSARGRADVGMSEAVAARRYASFHKHTLGPVRPDQRAAALAPRLEEWLGRGELPPLLPEPDPALGLKGFLELSGSFISGAAPHAGGELSMPERLNRAEAVLCRAALRHGQEAPLWTARARLARQQNKHDLAGRFLDQALGRAETFAIYEEWFQLCLARSAQQSGPASQKTLQQAKAILEYMSLQQGEGENHARKMAMYDKMLHKLAAKK